LLSFAIPIYNRRVFKPALLLLVVFIISLEINLQTSNSQRVKRVLAAQTEYSNQSSKLQRQYDSWQQVVIEHPGYRDGYLQLAIISLEMGQKNAAQSWLKKVYDLDPNYLLPPTLVSQLAPLL